MWTPWCKNALLLWAKPAAKLDPMFCAPELPGFELTNTASAIFLPLFPNCRNLDITTISSRGRLDGGAAPCSGESSKATRRDRWTARGRSPWRGPGNPRGGHDRRRGGGAWGRRRAVGGGLGFGGGGRKRVSLLSGGACGADRREEGGGSCTDGSEARRRKKRRRGAACAAAVGRA